MGVIFSPIRPGYCVVIVSPIRPYGLLCNIPALFTLMGDMLCKMFSPIQSYRLLCIPFIHMGANNVRPYSHMNAMYILALFALTGIGCNVHFIYGFCGMCSAHIRIWVWLYSSLFTLWVLCMCIIFSPYSPPWVLCMCWPYSPL
jgi:hypothetical protein